MLDLPEEPLRLQPAVQSAPAAASVPPPLNAAALQRPPLVASEALMQGHKAIEISHNGVVYRLQATRLGKLILTK